MGVEIERKFLVKGDAWRSAARPVLLRQGYLSSHPERVVRVRIEDGQAMMTIKGRSVGACRGEWEYPIPLLDAEAFLAQLGVNAGLVVAEIELSFEGQVFSRPDWIGAEVTDDARYFNSNLIRHPFSKWQG